MPRIRYEDWKPQAEAIDVIRQAQAIAQDYANQGYDLTLRQLYYQFVSRDLIPNTERSYKRLGTIVNKARLGGLLDWNYIVDRTCNVAGINHFETADEMVSSLADYYSEDHWEDQDFHVEVWVEKEALAGVVQRAAGRFGIPYFACRGYVSQSELWAAGRRLLSKVVEGKNVLVLHLGDHDPSGIDMTRDIKDRLRTFTTQDFLNDHAEDFVGDRDEDGRLVVPVRRILEVMAQRTADPDLQPIEVRRIALNMDQVEEYGPPPNPAKMTDSRVADYLVNYGDESWELDALEPAVLDRLIRDNVEEVIDWDRWSIHQDAQRKERARLRWVSNRWGDLAAEYDDLPEDVRLDLEAEGS